MKLADQRADEQHREIARLDGQVRNALDTSTELGMELVHLKGQLAAALRRADNLEKAMHVQAEKQAVVCAQQEAEVRRLAETMATVEEQRDLALAAAVETEIERDRALAAAAERDKERASAVSSAAQAARELAAQQDEFIVNLTEDYEEKLASSTRALQDTRVQSRDADAARERELSELRAASEAMENELREARELGRRLEAQRDEAVAQAERRGQELDDFATGVQAAREAELGEVRAVALGLEQQLDAARGLAERLQAERDESLRGLEAAQLELAELRKKLEADLLAGQDALHELRSERDQAVEQPAMALASPMLRRDVEEMERSHDRLERERDDSMRALAELRVELAQAQGIIKQLEERLASGEQQAGNESARGSRASERAGRPTDPAPAREADTFDGDPPGSYFVAGEAIREETVLRSARRSGSPSQKPTRGGAARRKA
jgi:chromosome segregation ATPase